jgi:hypothetical protein
LPGPVKPRAYDNARRAAAARRTQERVERGWVLDDYERWLATSLTAALLPAPATPPTSS